MTALELRPPSLFASRVVRGWTRLYTAGAPAAIRERRLTQIDSDLWEESAEAALHGAHPLLTTANILGRMVRGMPADILWRTGYGGPTVNLHLSLPRATGALLLALAIAAVVGTSIQGYDSSYDAWPDAFREIGDKGAATLALNTVFFALAGLGAIAVAGLLAALLVPRQRVLASAATALLAASGVAVLVGAGLYSVIAGEALDYARGERDATIIEQMRAVVLVLDACMFAAAAGITLSGWLLAAAVIRIGLAPRWTAAFPVLSVAAFGVYFVANSAMDSDWTWFIWVSTLMFVMLWLLVTGLVLVVRGATLPGPQPLREPA
jgi:hypothetical protein